MSEHPKETRAEGAARIDGNLSISVPLGDMVEVGYLLRGLRGQRGYETLINGKDFVYRDDEQEEPQSYRLFVFIPPSPEPSGDATK